MERWREEARPRVRLARWIPRYVTREIKGPAIMSCEIDRVLFALPLLSHGYFPRKGKGRQSWPWTNSGQPTRPGSSESVAPLSTGDLPGGGAPRVVTPGRVGFGLARLPLQDGLVTRGAPCGPGPGAGPVRRRPRVGRGRRCPSCCDRPGRAESAKDSASGFDDCRKRGPGRPYPAAPSRPGPTEAVTFEATGRPGAPGHRQARGRHRQACLGIRSQVLLCFLIDIQPAMRHSVIPNQLLH